VKEIEKLHGKNRPGIEAHLAFPALSHIVSDYDAFRLGNKADFPMSVNLG